MPIHHNVFSHVLAPHGNVPPDQPVQGASSSPAHAASGGNTIAGGVSRVAPSDQTAASLAQQWQLSSPADDAARHALAIKLTEKLRARVTSPIHRKMMATGRDWRPNQGAISAKMLSATNMRNLYRKLRNLDDVEKEFLTRFYATPLQITHATNHDPVNQQGHVELYSRKKLLERGILFPTDNTDEADLKFLATDDHVFFALEEGAPQKSSSRFGRNMFRFPFDQPAVQQQSLMHLFDPVEKVFPSAPAWLEGFDQLPRTQQQKALDNLNHHTKSMNTVNSLFHGPHMRPGLALSIIERSRYLPHNMRQDLLKRSDLNKLINGLYRPQILVPRHFYGKPTDARTLGGNFSDIDAATLLTQMLENDELEEGEIDESAPAADTGTYQFDLLQNAVDNQTSFTPHMTTTLDGVDQNYLQIPQGSMLNNVNTMFGTQFNLPVPMLNAQHANFSAAPSDYMTAVMDPMTDAQFDEMFNQIESGAASSPPDSETAKAAQSAAPPTMSDAEFQQMLDSLPAILAEPQAHEAAQVLASLSQHGHVHAPLQSASYWSQADPHAGISQADLEAANLLYSFATSHSELGPEEMEAAAVLHSLQMQHAMEIDSDADES